MRAHVNHLTADTMTAALNKLVDLDPRALAAFCERAIPVAATLAAAPGVCTRDEPASPSGAAMTLLGLLQAFYSTVGRRLVAHYDDADRLTHFDHDEWPAAQGPPFLDAAEVLRAS